MKASIILPYTHYAGWVKNAPKDTEFILLEKQGDAHENNGFIRVNQNYQLYLWRKFVAEGNMDGAINNRADTPNQLSYHPTGRCVSDARRML